MGGKAAMQAALMQPDAVARLIVADIAPVPYPPHLRPTAEAMAALPLAAGMTRAEADAALAEAVPDAGMRAFLLQNLQLGAAPAWRIGLAEIIAAFADIEAWDVPDDARYTGPTLFIAGRDVELHQATAPPGDPRTVPECALRYAEECRTLAACRKSDRLRRRGRSVFDSRQLIQASSQTCV